MKPLKPFYSALLLMAISLPYFSTAQINVPKALQRYQAGYSFPMTSATYTEHTLILNEAQDDYIDTSFSKTVKTKGGFGVSMGTYFPVAKMSQQSCLAVSLDFLYNFMVWDANTVTYDGYDYSTGSYSYNTNYVITAATVHMGLPVGIDFKYGGDATLDRSNKLCVSVGTGVYPSLNLTAYEANAGVKFKMQPYLKGEFGFFAGICWKVRALYSFGKLNYIDVNDNFDSDYMFSESNATLSSKSSLTLTLLLMPFSFGWEKSEWWR